MSQKLLSVLAFSLICAGCASGVSRGPSTANQAQVRVAATKAVGTVTLSLTDPAKEKLKENPIFNTDELLAHVKQALEAKSLLATNMVDTQHPNLEIQLKDMRVRSGFAAVMFGFMAGSDSLTGDVVLKNADGKEVDRFEVSASYALGGSAGGDNKARMTWLYDKFAELTVKELTGQEGEAGSQPVTR